MDPWIECVPNVSEGRRTDILDALLEAIRPTGVRSLGFDADPDHHRAVFTFAGPCETVERAALAFARAAVERIDLRAHAGVHPRVGAIDVLPFVPLEGATIDLCAAAARRAGERIAEDLEVPVYFYGAASPSGRTLPEIRRGGLEALAASVASDPDRRPDLGPTRLHPTAGAIAIGARPFLIAFNVNLAGATLGAARSIARGIRESSGGLPGIRALGLSLESRGLVQVSINVCDHRRTSLARVFREIRERAKAAGARVVESEIVGFVPREALVLSAIEGLALGPAAASKILEDAIGPRDEGLAAYLDALGSASPAPGGGSAAAVVAALAAALARMVAAVGERRAKRGGSEPGGIAALADLLQRADRLRDRLLDLKRRDEAAYAAHVQARKAGDDAAAAALRRAAEVPVDIMEAAADAGGLAREAGALVGGAIAADADAASALAAAACEVASFGLRANLEGLPGDAFRAELTDRARAALRACAAHRPPPGV